MWRAAGKMNPDLRLIKAGGDADTHLLPLPAAFHPDLSWTRLRVFRHAYAGCQRYACYIGPFHCFLNA